MEKKISRKFKGPLVPREEPVHRGFEGLSNNEYENMQKKHFHAYKMGYTYFTYKGKVYEVEQEYYEVQ